MSNTQHTSTSLKMAQAQPRRQSPQHEQQQQQQQPIRYGDVFSVSEKLANEPIAPKDAIAMQSAENQELGHIQRGGPAAVMQSAATKNVQAGVLPPGVATDIASHEGVRVTKTGTGGRRVITESVGDQVVAHYTDPNPNPRPDRMVAPPISVDSDAVTIGEALEASAMSAGDKPIDQSDAAAIQTAEMLAIGSYRTPPGGIGSESQAAASANERVMGVNKTTLADVLTDATAKLKDDRPANVHDAERVIAAEMRNNPDMATGGVAESVAAAARLNLKK